nr:hypothetical protein [Micromonospora inositola]
MSGNRDPRFFAVLLGLLGLSAAAALAAPDSARACAPAPPLAGAALSQAVLVGAATPAPTAPAADCGTPRLTPSPTRSVGVGRWLPLIAAEPGQPMVATTSSKLTGSKVTMTGLRFEGIVDLPTAEGTLKVLKFSTDQAVTDDFLLRAPGPAGRTLRYAARRLTVEGDVAFYVTRFVGRLLGIEITLAPNLPLPESIPITSSSSITFADPAIDLAFVTSDVLTARPKLTLD